MVAGEQGREQSDACWQRENEPDHLPDQRASKIERGPGLDGDDLDANGHLAERLSPGRERNQVAAVLQREECDERRPRDERQIVEADAADLEREIDNDRVD